MITARESRLVSAEVDGRVEQLLVQEGQRIAAGAPIAVLDATELEQQVEAARGAEDEARARLRQVQGEQAEAGRIYRQLRGLLADGAVSRDAVKSAASAYAIAGAQVEEAAGALRRARATREQAEQQASRTTVTSPIDGVITLVKIRQGQSLGRGQPVAHVFDPSDLWVRFAVPPERRDGVSAGDRITVLPLQAGPPLAATVRVVHDALEPPLELAVVEADVDDAGILDRDARLGTMVDVRLGPP